MRAKVLALLLVATTIALLLACRPRALLAKLCGVLTGERYPPAFDVIHKRDCRQHEGKVAGHGLERPLAGALRDADHRPRLRPRTPTAVPRD